MKIAPERAALVLIDLQRGLFDAAPPSSFLAERRADLLQRTARLIEVMRKGGFPVFYVKVVRPTLTGELPANDPLVVGTPGADFAPEIAPAARDIVIEKLRVSAFYGTRLDGFLRQNGIRSLIISGIYTNIGVDSTVRDAWDRFYDVTVIEDCCAALTREAHESALKFSFPRFAKIAVAEEIVGAMQAGKLVEEGAR